LGRLAAFVLGRRVDLLQRMPEPTDDTEPEGAGKYEKKLIGTRSAATAHRDA
jgi:hypothetical protein